MATFALLHAASCGLRASARLAPPRFGRAMARLVSPRCCSSSAPAYPATEALYLSDTALLETTATVIGLEESEKGWAAVLDATVFHPQGGGQPADMGTIGDAAVLSVFSEGRAGSGGVVYHALESQPKFAVGDEVACRVDAEHRAHSARTHSAGHLIDVAMQRCSVELVPTKGYHWPDGAYVEYADPPETRMTPEQRDELLPRLQDALDALLAEDAPTQVEADADGTRVVTVGGLPCPCGGTHVSSAAQIGAVKIEAIKKKGSGKKAALRVSYSMA